jgi:exodeoxyribonuclease VII small subunit
MPKTVKPTFEASMDKLAALTEAVEAPETPLEQALELYKEGIALAKSCGEALTRYEEAVMLLKREADGLFTLEPFGEA